jgi:hypothetical protein
VNTPYLSTWSTTDNLFDSWPTHWAGMIKAICGVVSIDGNPYRFMGDGTAGQCPGSPMLQVNLTVAPLTTTYVFTAAGVQLTVKFITPGFADRLESLALPLTFVTFDAASADGGVHHVHLYWDNTAEQAVSDVSQAISWDAIPFGQSGMSLRFGTTQQNYLGQGSDTLNWGYSYTAFDSSSGASYTIAGAAEARAAFSKSQPLPPMDTRKPRNCDDDWPVAAIVFEMGSISKSLSAHAQVIFAYDEVFVME